LAAAEVGGVREEIFAGNFARGTARVAMAFDNSNRPERQVREMAFSPAISLWWQGVLFPSRQNKRRVAFLPPAFAMIVYF
jgi:hypothetical protein